MKRVPSSFCPFNLISLFQNTGNNPNNFRKIRDKSSQGINFSGKALYQMIIPLEVNNLNLIHSLEINFDTLFGKNIP
jgi:hypothetical protein